MCTEWLLTDTLVSPGGALLGTGRTENETDC